MKARRLKWIFFILFLAFLGASKPEIELERAKVLFDKGDYQNAYSLLTELNRISPNDPAVLRYLGLTEFALGKKEESIESLRKAATIAEDKTEFRLDYVWVLYQAGRLKEADAELSKVLQKEPDNSRALILRAELAMKRGEFSKAKKDLEKAREIDADVFANVGYLLGICAKSLGDYEQARNYWQEVIEKAPESEWTKMSENALKELPEKKEKKYYDATFQILYQYDTNVVPVADEDYLPSYVKDQEDSRTVVMFYGLVYPLREQKKDLALGYNFYNSWHFEDIDFNLQLHQGSLHGGYNFKIGDMNARLGGMYLYQYAGLGDEYDYYSTIHRIRPYLYLQETKNSFTEFNYYWESEVFAKPGEDDMNRDNSGNYISLRQHFLLFDSKLDIGAGASYFVKNAKGDNYDVNRTGGSVWARLIEWNKLSSYLEATYENRDYYKSDFLGDKRKDDILFINFGADYKIYKELKLYAGINYSDYNSTIEFFDYDRLIYSLGFSASF